MRIKVYTYKNKATISDDFQKVKEFFKFNNLEISLDISETSVKKGYALEQLMIPQEGKFDIVMYVYERSYFSAPSFGMAFYISPKLCGIYQATTEVDDRVDYTWKSMCHEIMHCLFFKYNIHHLDPMDSMMVNGEIRPYYKNEQPYAPDGNFAKAFQILAPFINPTYKKTVVITRNKDDGYETLGVLNTEGFSCKTLERPWKNNQPNISCIPKGTYNVRWSFSPRFLKYTYEVLNVPNRSGIRFHSGNFFYDINGCILLGKGIADINGDDHLDLFTSTQAVNEFVTFMNKRDFTLIIQ